MHQSYDFAPFRHDVRETVNQTLPPLHDCMSKYNSIVKQLRCGVQVNLYPLEFVPRACVSFRFLLNNMVLYNNDDHNGTFLIAATM